MRAKDFLLEYRRDVTAQKMGDKLISAFQRLENGSSLPDNLYGAWTVVDMVVRPQFHFDKSIIMNILGQRTSISKATAPEILQQIKPALVDAILAQLEEGDPTPHKEYSQWVAARYITGDTQMEDVGSTLREYLYKFNVLKRKKMLKPPANDINKYNSFGNFMDNMDQYALPEDEVVNKGKSTEVYRSADVRVIVPEDEPAACYYGRGTRWCTAATQGNNYYNHYSRQGPLYILLPQHPKYDGEKYQLHFPSDQFMDEEDEQVDSLSELLSRFDLVRFFKQQEPEIKEYIAFADDSVLVPLLKRIKEIGMELFYDEVTAWEDQDDSWHSWRHEQAFERGYVTDDGDVDWDQVGNDRDLNDYEDYNEDMKYWHRAVETALNYSPDSIRYFLESDRDGNNDRAGNGTGDDYKLDQLDAVMARIVRYETANNDDQVAEDIERTIAVRRDNNRIQRTDPEWTVSRVGGYPR